MEKLVSLSYFTRGVPRDFEKVMSKKELGDNRVHAFLHDAKTGFTWFIHGYSSRKKIAKISTSNLYGEICLLEKYIVKGEGKYSFLQLSELPRDLFYYIELLDESVTYSQAVNMQMNKMMGLSI